LFDLHPIDKVFYLRGEVVNISSRAKRAKWQNKKYKNHLIVMTEIVSWLSIY